MTLRIAQFGDLHAGHRFLRLVGDNGVNQHEQDIYDALDAAITYVINHEPKFDVCVWPGDIYDSLEPPPLAEAAIFRAADRLAEAGILVIGTSGNHDHHKLGQITPLMHLSDHFNCHIALEQGHVDVPDPDGGTVRFHQIPWVSLAAHAEGRKPLEPLEFLEDIRDTNILIAHASAAGRNVPPAIIEFDPIQVPPSLIKDPRMALTLLAHIHIHARIDPELNAFYGGVLERQTFGEVEQTPGFWAYEVGAGQIIGTPKSITMEQVSQELGLERPLPRPMHTLRLAQNDMTVDEIHRLVLTRIHEIVKPGMLMKIIITGADQQLRGSEYPRRWADKVRELGGSWCENDIRAAISGDLLDEIKITEDMRSAGQIEQVFVEWLIEQNRQDLVEDARRALGEVK